LTDQNAGAARGGRAGTNSFERRDACCVVPHSYARTTKLHERTSDEVTFDEAVKIPIRVLRL